MPDALPPAEVPSPVPAPEPAPRSAPEDAKEPPLLILSSLPERPAALEIQLVSSPPPVPIEVPAPAQLMPAPANSAELLPPVPAPATVPPAPPARPPTANIPAGQPPPASATNAAVPPPPAASAPPPPSAPVLQPAFAGAAALPRAERGRGWAACAHLLLFLVIPTLFLGGVLTFFLWQILGKDDPFVEDQTREALNFQINVGVLSFLLGCTLVGLPLVILLWILAGIVSLIAALHAWRGERYRYPLVVRVVTH